MAQQTKSYLKSRFVAGAKPSEQDFIDFIDSLVHVDDIEAVNASVIDTRINAYDTAQKAQTEGLTISTIGDVLNILRSFAPNVNVKTLLDAASGAVNWADVQEKPSTVGVTWEEHTFQIDTYQAPPFTTYEGLTAVQLVKMLAPAELIANKKWVILDVIFTQFQVPLYGQSTSYYAQRIRAVTIGVSPKISLS
jgi:hypothetical protein